MPVIMAGNTYAPSASGSFLSGLGNAMSTLGNAFMQANAQKAMQQQQLANRSSFDSTLGQATPQGFTPAAQTQTVNQAMLQQPLAVTNFSRTPMAMLPQPQNIGGMLGQYGFSGFGA